MKLCDILNGVAGVSSSLNKEFDDIASDSRRLKDGAETLFFAYAGAAFDSHKTAEELFKAGKVSLVVAEREIEGVKTVIVKDGRRAFSAASANFFKHPEKKLKLIGLTGTNGKTTTAYLLTSIFKREGIARIGTTGAETVKGGTSEFFEIDNTTPGPYDFFKILSAAKEVGAGYACAEVSSHALDQSRIAGVCFDVGVFTNLTGDHLDYHKDFESYYQAKKLLFTDEYSEKRLVNVGNAYGRRLFKEIGGEKLSYGVEDGDLRALSYSSAREGLKAELDFKGDRFTIESALAGRHNLENILAALGAAILLGKDPAEAIKGIGELINVPGRLERYGNVYVDYAHTDDALKNVLSALREFTKGKIITVFGAGGDRDKTKRPRMGQVVEEFSDTAVVTSDNPRTEEPLSIIEDILRGFKERQRAIVEPDRAKAIALAMAMAKQEDAVLVAGKGHETYQIVGKEKRHFSDSEVVSGQWPVASG